SARIPCSPRSTRLRIWRRRSSGLATNSRPARCRCQMAERGSHLPFLLGAKRQLHVQMVGRSDVTERAESHRPEVELHEATPDHPLTGRAEIDRMHPTVELAVVHRSV